MMVYRQIIDQCTNEYKNSVFRIIWIFLMGYFFPNGELDTQNSIEY